MLGRCVWIAVVLGLLLAAGCTRDRIVSPADPGDVRAEDGAAGPPLLIPEQQVNTWSELKRRYAGRPPKDDD